MQFMNNLILDNFKRENNLNQLIKGKKEGFAIHPTTNETETQCSENGNKDIIPKNSGNVNRRGIDPDDIYELALYIEQIRYLMQDMIELYFYSCDPNTKEGQISIIYDFPRYRAKAEIIDNIAFKIQNTLMNIGITR